MRYLSVCSGIEAVSVAWHPLGFEPVGFSEIDKFPSAVLSARFPHVRNYGDMNGFESWDLEAIDVLVGGTPCQSFSVAGLRKGLGDERGNLALVYCRILERFRPKWFVWENVPGVLSSGRGRDFGSFLGAVAKLGYGFAYRVLDAQFFGVPQRRRRVFVVGCLGAWQRAAAVLFESESLRRDTSKGKGSKQKVAGTLGARANSSHREDSDSFVAMGTSRAGNGNQSGGVPFLPCGATIHGTNKTVKVMSYTDIAGSLRTKPPGSQENSSSTAVLAFSCKDYAADSGPISPTLRSMNHSESHTNAGGQVAVAWRMDSNSNGFSSENDTYPTIEAHPQSDSSGRQKGIRQGMQVRRLTPEECERLQGLPSKWTAIEYRGKPASDGPRYKAIGNSMAVPVMQWIGERLAMVAANAKL